MAIVGSKIFRVCGWVVDNWLTIGWQLVAKLVSKLASKLVAKLIAKLVAKIYWQIKRAPHWLMSIWTISPKGLPTSKEKVSWNACALQKKFYEWNECTLEYLNTTFKIPRIFVGLLRLIQTHFMLRMLRLKQLKGKIEGKRKNLEG